MHDKKGELLAKPPPLQLLGPTWPSLEMGPGFVWLSRANVVLGEGGVQRCGCRLSGLPSLPHVVGPCARFSQTGPGGMTKLALPGNARWGGGLDSFSDSFRLKMATP